MDTNWRQVQSATGFLLIATGLLWGARTQFAVHAQPASAPVQAAASLASSGVLKVENGKIEVRQIRGSLGDTINGWAANTGRPEWLGYSVGQVNVTGFVCCEHENSKGSERCDECRLEDDDHGINLTTRNSGNPGIWLEAPRELAVLFRAESGKLNQIRILSMRCTADAGGLTVLWLGRANSRESLHHLEKVALDTDPDSANSGKLANSALAAIALHADPAADRALESFVAAHQLLSLRKEAVFWFGEARGAEGLRVLEKMAQTETNSDVREQITFALSISKEPGALPELTRMAHDDESPRVRGQALFWLGQEAGQKAAHAISGEIDDDPDTEVKKKAVFALSQMSPDQGVPKLIAVAQTNRNPQVRKEAMFWLGQSEDPQALAFLEKILTQ